MKHREYCLKASAANKIFRKILEKCRESFEIVQLYKSADDYAQIIFSNPDTTPEILFEEDLNEVADEHTSNSNFLIIYGNLEYGTERTIKYLLVFVNKILIAQLYGVEWTQMDESKLTVKFKILENPDDVAKKAVNLIEETIKEKTLFKE